MATELKIRGNLRLGKLRIQPVSLSTEFVSNKEKLGGLFTTKYPIPCDRCNGSNFHICNDGDDLVAFCANEKCLSDDCTISKEITREEYLKRQERNDHGQIMTGAEKFGMGSSYKHACLVKWVAPESLQKIVVSWFNDARPFLVVMGNPGTGKTFLSAAILNYLFEKKQEVCYTTHRRFIEEIHRALEDGKTQHSVIDKYSYKKYLIIDDLGAATCSEWQQEMLLELLDRRYSDRLKTLVTSNLNRDQIKSDFGIRTHSRLFDQKNAIFEVWGNDKRQDASFSEN